MTLRIEYATLPAYSPSEPSPAYSHRPTRDERSLQQTCRRVFLAPTGTFIRKSGKLKVTLFEQEDGIDVPIYTQNRDISGVIAIEEPHKISKVTLKIEGKLDTRIAVGGSKVTDLMRFSSTLWEKGNGSELSGHLPFSQSLPSTFIHEGSQKCLPPTYCVHEGSAFNFAVKYTLTISLSQGRHSVELLKRSDKIEIPFNYHPRSRPHRPILTDAHFLPTIKSCPEEWHQTSSTIRGGKEVEAYGPIHCDFFVPATRVYGLTDQIPFHIQFNATSQALQNLLPRSQVSIVPFSGKNPPSNLLKIKVCLLRQSKIETRGIKLWNTSTIGEGDIWELPPGHCRSSNSISLDFAGMLQPKSCVMVGGFFVSNVSVGDFISLTLDPPVNNKTWPFLPFQMTVPVRIVTDSYIDLAGYDHQVE